MGGGGGTPLPPDAVMIEYIGTYGSQYIDTGYYPSEISNLTCDFIPMAVDRGRLFGTRTQNPVANYDVTLYDTTSYGALTRIGLSSNVAVKPIAVGSRYTLKIDAVAHRAYLNGTAFTLDNYTTFQCTQSLLLFALHDYNNVIIAFGSAKLYSLYIEENGQKVIDLIPIRIGQVGYMFDKVNGNLYKSAGAREFVLGPDKN